MMKGVSNLMLRNVIGVMIQMMIKWQYFFLVGVGFFSVDGVGNSGSSGGDNGSGQVCY